MTAQETSSPDVRAPLSACKYPDRQSLPGSADRNAPAISNALKGPLSQLPKNSKILELAAGHGVLTTQMAAAWPSLRFSASEADDGLVEAIRQRCQGLGNVKMIQRLEFSNAEEWEQLQQQGPFDLVVVANVLHIVPWLMVEDLFTGMAQKSVLNGTGGRVCIYGAFNEGGRFTSEGNEKFDRMLKERNTEYGLRDVESEVVPLATSKGLAHEDTKRLPAGNLLLTFIKR